MLYVPVFLGAKIEKLRDGVEKWFGGRTLNPRRRRAPCQVQVVPLHSLQSSIIAGPTVPPGGEN